MITGHSTLIPCWHGCRFVVPGSVQLIQDMGYSVPGQIPLIYYVNEPGLGWVGLSA